MNYLCSCICVYFLKLLVEPIHNKIKMKRIKGMKSFTECLLVVDRLLLGSSMVVVGDSRSIFGFRLNEKKFKWKWWRGTSSQ